MINDKLYNFSDLDRKAQPDAVANCIDIEIHKNYKIYPCNYIAYDMLYADGRFAAEYTQDQKSKFEAYLEGQINKIPNPDVDFLKLKLLEMYSNTLKNKMAVS